MRATSAASRGGGGPQIPVPQSDDEEEQAGLPQPEVRTAGLGTLKLETFSGSRNPMVFRDWKRSVDAVEILSGLPPEELAVYVWLSLKGEAKKHVPPFNLV